jgi:hypothetical protein
MEVYEYFHQKEKEYRELCLTPSLGYDGLFAEEAGSDGKRGVILGNLQLDCEADAFLAVHEVVVVEGNHVHREEYAYFLVINGAEVWGYERDPTHDPPVHKHTEGHLERLPNLAWIFSRTSASIDRRESRIASICSRLSSGIT